jgi:excisionase family DNA binding protein
MSYHNSEKKPQKSLGFEEKERHYGYRGGREKEVDMSEVTLLSMKQTMAYLNVSQWILYQLINSRKLPTVMLGSRRLIRLSAVKDYLDSVETKKIEDDYDGFY